MSNYKIGDKLVLEITGDGERMSVTNLNICIPNEELDKLDRLDSDYVNEHYGMLQDEAYEQGLGYAWELAKKLENLGRKTLYEIFKIEDVRVIDILETHTMPEVIAKIEGYEKTHFQRGDEVILVDTDEKALFYGESDDKDKGWFLIKDHIVPGKVFYAEAEKTGKRVNIDSIFEGMDDDEDLD